MNDNNAGTLLPYSAITPELLDEAVKWQAAQDEGLEGRVPEYWSLVAEVTRKSEFIGSAIESAYLQIQREGVKKSITGIVLKCILLGWRLAELHLQKEVDKGVQ